jgi:hypothetical protein
MQGFDHRVHIRDSKTGKIIQKQPYQYVVSDKGSYYVRDGVKYNPDGSVIEEKKPAVTQAPSIARTKNGE